MRDRGVLDEFGDVKKSQSVSFLVAYGRNFEFHSQM